MSCNYSLGYGYVIEFAKVLELVTDGTVRSRINELLEEFPSTEQDVIEVCNAVLEAKGLPPVVELVQFDDEDELSEEMEYGVIYALFDEDALYTKELSTPGKQLAAHGIRPMFDTWSRFG